MVLYKVIVINMFVIFVSYVWFCDNRFAANMFSAPERAAAEEAAKLWLLDQVGFLFDDAAAAENARCRDVSLDDLLDYMNKNTDVHVIVKPYEH